MASKRGVYEGEYLPFIVRFGKVTGWLAVLLSFGPAIVLAAVYGLIPPASAIFTAFIALASAVGVNWFVEPISYFPIIGVAGTYMAFISGNISNLRIPAAAIAQKMAGVEPGTPEGSIVATLGMAVSVLVNTLILVVGVLAGSTLLARLPANVVEAFDYLLPSLFGAIFVQFAMVKFKLAPIALGIALALTLAINGGVFDFLPGRPTYLITLCAVFGTIAIAAVMHKRESREGAKK
ncbi:MAG: hypothetical protein QM372_10405 [Bacillota bacterium]|jgi:hypothetical protein|nr:hypothetical protein [Bacillota bacterium]NLJ02102.1 hypothetical protein [Bacillota bacterium]